MTSQPPERIIAGVRRGEESACSTLIDYLYPVIMPIVRKNRPVRDEEEDIVQEIFIKVFSRIKQFSGQVPFSHWVSRVALNTCYDLLRRQQKQPDFQDIELELDTIAYLGNKVSMGPRKFAEMGGELAKELLETLLATLTRNEQVVIRLLDLQEKSILETCELTGWGASKVKVTAMRARRKLKRALTRLESESQNHQKLHLPSPPVAHQTAC